MDSGMIDLPGPRIHLPFLLIGVGVWVVMGIIERYMRRGGETPQNRKRIAFVGAVRVVAICLLLSLACIANIGMALTDPAWGRGVGDRIRQLFWVSNDWHNTWFLTFMAILSWLPIVHAVISALTCVAARLPLNVGMVQRKLRKSGEECDDAKEL